MATSLRGGANNNGGKEKRGTSPSSFLKKTSKASSSSSVNEEKMSSSPTETSSKPVPNYLKPTMSSSLDFSRLPKKSSGPEKPALNRRRSFDRPPPSAQVQRAVRGPSGSGGRDMKPQRSTSFNVRPASEKLFARTSSLKDKKLEEPKLSLKSKQSVKKSTLSLSSSSSPNKEQASSKKAPRSVTSESSLDYENNNNNDNELVDCLIREEDDLVNLDEHEVQSLPEMSEMPDVTHELADPNPTNFEVGELVKPLDEQDKSAVSDELVPLEEEDSAEVHNQKESAGYDDVQLKAEDDQLKAEDDQLKGEDAGEQKLVVESTEDQKDEEGEKTVSEVGPTTEATVEEKKEEEEETKATEAEKKEEIIITEEKESAVSSPSGGEAEKTQSSGGQKDKQAYNDVIEETATKLRGKKNKVLALAGAFETVISLDKS